MMQRTQYQCMVFNQIYDLNRSAQHKTIYIELVFFFSDKEAIGRMISHNKGRSDSENTEFSGR